MLGVCVGGPAGGVEVHMSSNGLSMVIGHNCAVTACHNSDRFLPLSHS